MTLPAEFYRLKTGATLFSFGDEIGDVPVLGCSLRSHQEQLIARLGARVHDIAHINELPSDRSSFWFDDDLYFDKGWLDQVVRATRGKPQSLRFCLNHNSANLRYALPDNEGFKTDTTSQIRPRFGFKVPNTTPVDCPIDQQLFRNQVAMPVSMVRDAEFSYDQTTALIARIYSPFHLLQANLGALLCQSAPLRSKLPRWLDRGWLKPDSGLARFLLKRQNRIGKRCKIHPTAVLEGADIGDDVTIGAHAVVRLSQIGSGTRIEDGCVIKYCILGSGNYICNSNQLVSCMSYDEVLLIHGPYQFSIFGRNTVVMAVLNCDVRLDRATIHIPTPGGILDSRQPFLGIAYGHKSKVGAGNSIAPGRIVPNELQLTPPGILLRFDSTSAETGRPH